MQVNRFVTVKLSVSQTQLKTGNATFNCSRTFNAFLGINAGVSNHFLSVSVVITSVFPWRNNGRWKQNLFQSALPSVKVESISPHAHACTHLQPCHGVIALYVRKKKHRRAAQIDYLTASQSKLNSLPSLSLSLSHTHQESWGQVKNQV